MNLVYIAPWLVWFLWFIGWEINGFRNSHDRWPTLSELVKRWEAQRQQMVYRTVAHRANVKSRKGVPYMRGVRVKGIATWSWRRWFIAGGLPVLGIVLEMHWVWELF